MFLEVLCSVGATAPHADIEFWVKFRCKMIPLRLFLDQEFDEKIKYRGSKNHEWLDSLFIFIFFLFLVPNHWSKYNFINFTRIRHPY